MEKNLESNEEIFSKNRKTFIKFVNRDTSSPSITVSSISAHPPNFQSFRIVSRANLLINMKFAYFCFSLFAYTLFFFNKKKKKHANNSFTVFFEKSKEKKNQSFARQKITQIRGNSHRYFHVIGHHHALLHGSHFQTQFLRYFSSLRVLFPCSFSIFRFTDMIRFLRSTRRHCAIQFDTSFHH